MAVPAWMVAVPSLAVIITALISKDVLLSLAIGISMASLIAVHFHPVYAIQLAFHRLFQQTDIPTIIRGEAPDHLYTFGFILLLGILIVFITHMGGAEAYSRWLRTKLKTKRQAQVTTLVLASGFFLDDYLNALTTGCIMRPMTDALGIPPVKLAYLLNATASSLCILVPLSSWGAFTLSQIPAEKLSASSMTLAPFSLLLHALSYMIYPILSVLNAWFIVLAQISFGKMYQYEKETTSIEPVTSHCPQRGSLFDFFLPLGSFLIILFGLLLYTGNWHIFGGETSFGHALLNANILASLFYAVVFALLITIATGLYRNRLTWSLIKLYAQEGFHLMRNSLFLLLLAWTFSSLLQTDLHVAHYLEAAFSHIPAHLLLSWLPVTAFCLSTFVSASIGSTWGTISLLTPLLITLGVATPAASAGYLARILGSLLSGAVAGSQLSFISDASIVASTGAQADHYSHVATLIPYALPALAASFIVTLIDLPFLIRIALAITISWILLLIQNKNRKKLI